MYFSHSGQTNPVSPIDVGEARLWGRKTSSTGDHDLYSSALASPPQKFAAETPTYESGVCEVPLVGPDIQNDPHLVEAWSTRSDSHLNQRPEALDDTVATLSNNATPIQYFASTAAGDGKTAIGESVKERIDTFFEEMPVFMNALDELVALHPFIGVAVITFKTVYILELKRRENDKKIIALYVEMKDAMGALLLLKDVKDDRFIAPDGLTLEDRLKSLVDRTADDIKSCSNSCDTYLKKKLLPKVFLESIWNAKFLDFHGVDKANAKLDAIGDMTHTLNEKMDVMVVVFQQLVSPEQKQISALVDEMGGVSALRNNDKMLLYLDETVSKASSTLGAEGRRAPRENSTDAKPSADNIVNEIFEDPDAAAEKNQIVFFHKFEAQKNQIIQELSLVVEREGDRIIRETRSSLA
ncbi:hypothetical protein BJV77DRAFT_995584 [Russula vinacea]|nr:hypothetical protein BJV77DRAFT_995584 [Russula vinacea]